MTESWSILTERFGGGAIPDAPRISLSRFGKAGRASRVDIRAPSRGYSSKEIIASGSPDFYRDFSLNPSRTTTNIPGPYRDRGLSGHLVCLQNSGLKRLEQTIAIEITASFDAESFALKLGI